MQRGAVAALFGENAGSDGASGARIGAAGEGELDGTLFEIGGTIKGAGEGGGGAAEAIAAKATGVDAQRAVAGVEGAGEFGGDGAEVTGFNLELMGIEFGGGRRLGGKKLNGAGESGATPGTGTAAADDFGADEAEAWGFGPGDPAAKGVVKGNTVHEHEGAAGAVGTEVAQGNSLGGGVGGEGSGAAEEAERGGAFEGIVDGGRGGGAQLGLVENVDGDG